MNTAQNLSTGHFFDSADGTRTTIIRTTSLGAELVSVVCMVTTQDIPRKLLDEVKYTAAGYVAARERAAQECVA